MQNVKMNKDVKAKTLASYQRLDNMSAKQVGTLCALSHLTAPTINMSNEEM